MLKAVLFDLDGTIGDTLPLCVAAFKKAIEPLAGRSFTDREIMDTFGPTEEGTIQALIPAHYAQGLQQYLYYYKQLHGMCPTPFEGIPEILRYLREKQIPVGLVTGKGINSCRITLEQYGITHCFDTIETGSPQGPVKEAGIRKVLDHFGLSPAEAVYIGDSASDIRDCRAIGIPVIAAAWAETADIAALQALSPDALFTSVKACDAYLKDLTTCISIFSPQ